MRTVDIAEFQSILGSLPPDPRIIASGNFATPKTLLAVLDEALPVFTLNMLNAQPGIPNREGITLETSFVGPGMRKNPRLRYVPSRLSLVPRLFKTTLPPDAVIIHTSAPHEGAVSLGVETNVMPAAIEAAKARGGVVIAQMNPKMPYTLGDAEIKLDDIDYGVEVEEELATHQPLVIDEISGTIGELVSERVVDGATMQLGIGAVPDAVLHGLLKRRGLRVWSEMFSDGVLELDAAGSLDKDARLTASFIFGTRTLYDWVHLNPRVLMLRTETTNAPANIAANPNMVSVNTAIQVDLFGQANASRIKSRIYSGFGGQTDFIVGALHSPGGQAIMALRSWHPKANTSTIVPMIEEPMTSFQHTAVVTENGLAEVYGHDERTQAKNIIDKAANPKVREELREEARSMGLA